MEYIPRLSEEMKELMLTFEDEDQEKLEVMEFQYCL